VHRRRTSDALYTLEGCKQKRL